MKLPEELETKYAKFWHQTYGWEIPDELRPFQADERLVKRNKGISDLYCSGMWKVLNMMAEDGLISQEKLRELHDEMQGWKKGTSTIKIATKSNT